MIASRRNTARLARLAVIGLCVALAGCNTRHAPGRGERGRKHAEAVGVSVVIASASARAQSTAEAAKENAVGAPAAPKSRTRSGSPPVIRERVVSAVPYPSEADADEDAVTQACALVAQKLAELDPPVHYRPSPGEVRAEFLRKNSRTVRPPTEEEKKVLRDYGDTRKVVYVEYDVDVSAAQVRELRSQDRVSAGLRVLGVLVALAGAAFFFLRTDEWTRGYLTSWLALAAVALAGGAAAALIFI